MPQLPLTGTRVIASKPGSWTLDQVGSQVRFTAVAANGSCSVSTTQSVVAGQWMHVAGWYGGLEASATLDGARTTVTCTSGPVASSLGDALFVGGRLDADGITVTEDYSGRIDELRVRQTAPFIPTSTSGTLATSTILNATEVAQVMRWVGTTQSYQLCFRKSTHGTSAATFHAQCNHRGPSIVVIRFGDGRLAGGYTSVGWNSDNVYTGLDGEAFLFSLTAGRRYSVSAYSVRSSYSIYGSGGYGPTFGNGHDIYIADGLNSGYCNFPYAYSCNGSYGSPNATCETELCGSHNSWTVADLEVFVTDP
jgi:hypothetical protein